MLISLDNVSKHYGERTLFENVSLRVGARDRIALVGPNGAGKTTLMEIVATSAGMDSGTVSYAKGVSIGYLEQEAIELAHGTVLEAVMAAAADIAGLEHRMELLERELAAAEGDEQHSLLTEYGRVRDQYENIGGYSAESEARAVLGGLGFKPDDADRDVTEFSGGWQMRIALGRLLMSNPDVLLLDEPTNHLDLASVTWLEGFLRSYEGAVVLISHDRAFMDGLVNRVADLFNRTLTLYIGNYSSFLDQREQYIEQLEIKRAAQLREIEHMQKFVDRFRYKSSKAKAAQDRIERIEKIRCELVEVPPRQAKVNFSFPQPVRTGELVVSLESVSKAYGDNVVYSSVGLSLYRGDKVALVGPNGAGKSTLLKMLAGVLAPDAGTRSLGVHVDTGYFAQHQLEALNLSATVFDEVDAVAPGWTQGEVRRLLGAFLFIGSDVEKRVSVLSGGERARLALAKMLVKPAPFLALDEPSNHLDIQSADVLESALQQFEGTIAFITHDRHLIRAVANKVVEVDSGRITVYDGDYDYYLWKKEQAAKVDGTRGDDRAAAYAPTNGQRPSQAERKSKDERRLEAEARNARYRATRDARKRFDAVEGELAAVQAEHDELLTQMASPEFYSQTTAFDAAMARYAEVKQSIKSLEAEWLELAESIAKAEAID